MEWDWTATQSPGLWDILLLGVMFESRLGWRRSWRASYRDRDTATSKGAFQAASCRDSCAPLGKRGSQGSGCRDKAPPARGTWPRSPSACDVGRIRRLSVFRTRCRTVPPGKRLLWDTSTVRMVPPAQSPTNWLQRRKNWTKSKRATNTTCLSTKLLSQENCDPEMDKRPTLRSPPRTLLLHSGAHVRTWE